MRDFIVLGILSSCLCLIQCGGGQTATSESDPVSAAFVSQIDDLQTDVSAGDITDEEFAAEYLALLTRIADHANGVPKLKTYLEDTVLGYGFTFTDTGPSVQDVDVLESVQANINLDIKNSTTYLMLEEFMKSVTFAPKIERGGSFVLVLQPTQFVALSKAQVRSKIYDSFSLRDIDETDAIELNKTNDSNPFHAYRELQKRMGDEPSAWLVDAPKGNCLSDCQPIQGLVNMGNISFYNKTESTDITQRIPVNNPDLSKPYASSFAGMVINLTWEQLEADGPGLKDNNQLDQALEAVEKYNEENPDNPLAVKLRVWGGFVAPLWAKQINGGPIAVAPDKKNQTGTIGLWWTPEYIKAWTDFQELLAAKYDSNPLIVEVGVSLCGSDTDEPFVSWLDSDTITKLRANGFTDKKQKDCLEGILDAYGAWKETFIDFPFALFHTTYDNETQEIKIQPDTDFTKKVMNQCAASSNCILSNHALNFPLVDSDDIVYDTMNELYEEDPDGTLIDFQTAAPEKPLDWCDALVQGFNLHGLSVEIWPDFGGFTTLSAVEVANLLDVFTTGTISEPFNCPLISDI